MSKYECTVCGYVYDEEKEGIGWDNLTDWKCGVCEADKSYFNSTKEAAKEITKEEEKETDSDLSKSHDDIEVHMADIHKIAETGKSIIEPMRSRKTVIAWDDILFKGAQLSKIPLHQDDSVNTKTTIGRNAKHPLIIETPLIITHMSFGALSKEAKVALAKGSAKVKTAMCSGEGGILKESLENAYKYIFEYVPNEYSLTDENLKKVDAIEIKIGQSAKPGLGGHLPAEKVTKEIAEVRGKKEGDDIHSPPYFNDIKNKEDLKKKVDWLRERSGGKPIGVKIAAGNIEDDLEVIIYAKPDFITIDGRAGATGSAPKFVKDSTSVPTIFALNRARKFLDEKEIKGMSLIITGGLRVSSDFAKALALGADAIAIGTAALFACGCQQYKICHSGNCPVGITTQDPKLRGRIDIDASVKKLENFLNVSTVEIKDFARLTGNDDVHKLSVNDLCTINPIISDYTKIENVGGQKNVKN
tara:strand:+ start:321 stop:1736 length:1416 start_codon:yes stop_codon:yes gene_type:complete